MLSVKIERSIRTGGVRTLEGYRLKGTCSIWLGGLLADDSATGLGDWQSVSLETASVCSGGSAIRSPVVATGSGKGMGWETGVCLSATGTLESLS